MWLQVLLGEGAPAEHIAAAVTVISPVWNGRANLLELEVSGPTGRIEALSLRVYNPDSHQWSLNFSNCSSGTLGVPSVGEFGHGRGKFYDQETIGGRAVL
jgi:hypothetical protein